MLGILLILSSYGSPAQAVEPPKVYSLKVKKLASDTTWFGLQIKSGSTTKTLELEPDAGNWREAHIFQSKDEVCVIAAFGRSIYGWSYSEGMGLRRHSQSFDIDSGIVAAGNFGVLVSGFKRYQTEKGDFMRTVYTLFDAQKGRWIWLGGKEPPIRVQ